MDTVYVFQEVGTDLHVTWCWFTSAHINFKTPRNDLQQTKVLKQRSVLIMNIESYIIW
jgi:hypothetical protein